MVIIPGLSIGKIASLDDVLSQNNIIIMAGRLDVAAMAKAKKFKNHQLKFDKYRVLKKS